MPSTQATTKVFRVTFQFNWLQQGWQEVYYCNSTTLAAAMSNAGLMIPSRLAFMIPGPILFKVRVADFTTVGGGTYALAPGSRELNGVGNKGTFTTNQPFHTGPWDAMQLAIKGGQNVTRNMEIRGIPDTALGSWQNGINVAINWAAIVAEWKIAAPGTSWVVHSSTGLQNAVKVQAITIAQAPVPPLTIPNLGNIVINAPGHGIAVGAAVQVAFSKTKCTPKLNPRHIGVGIDNNTFFLKNTNEGQISYQGGGLVYQVTYNTPAITDIIPIFSCSKRPGRPFGVKLGRKQHKV
jgi:hypothetical protein